MLARPVFLQNFNTLIQISKRWNKYPTAVRWITDMETGGVLHPGDRCTNTGDRVIEVLRTKHPEARTPTAASLDSYMGRPPKLTLVDITEEMVMAVAGRLSGGARPGVQNPCHCNTGS